MLYILYVLTTGILAQSILLVRSMVTIPRIYLDGGTDADEGTQVAGAGGDLDPHHVGRLKRERLPSEPVGDPVAPGVVAGGAAVVVHAQPRLASARVRNGRPVVLIENYWQDSAVRGALGERFHLAVLLVVVELVVAP